MGAIAGRLQLGHRIRFPDTVPTGLCACIWLLSKSFFCNSFELLTINLKWSSLDRNASYFIYRKNLIVISAGILPTGWNI
jgi:hypothetical protein